MTSGAAGNTTTSYVYGAGGALDQVVLSDGRSRTVSFVNDASGQALRRDEADSLSSGDPHEVWYRFAGVEIGHIGNNTAALYDYTGSVALRGQATTSAAFGSPDTRYTEAFARDIDAITSYDTGAVGGRYVVRAGDTLASVAQSLWGDASLWYKLASANGLGAGATLLAGQILTVPAGVVRSTYNAATFTPYDPTDTLGDLSPVAAQPQARAKKNKCGVFGQVLLVAVAVAVTLALPGGGAGVAGIVQGAVNGAIGRR